MSGQDYPVIKIPQIEDVSSAPGASEYPPNHHEGQTNGQTHYKIPGSAEGSDRVNSDREKSDPDYEGRTAFRVAD